MSECINNSAVPVLDGFAGYQKHLHERTGYNAAEMGTTAWCKKSIDHKVEELSTATDIAESSTSQKLAVTAIKPKLSTRSNTATSLQRVTRLHSILPDRAVENLNSKMLTGCGVIWDCPISPSARMIASQTAIARSERMKQAFIKTARLGWRTELIVYAKLGYWAPEVLPKPLLQDLYVTDAEMASQLSSAAASHWGLKTGQHPAQSTSTIKRILRKLSDLDHFYRCLRTDDVSLEELIMAIYICQFGISLGMKRSMRSYEDGTHLRAGGNQSSLITTNMAVLNRMLNSHSGRSLKTRPLFELKGILNRLILVNLNEYREHEKYKTDEHLILRNSSTEWAEVGEPLVGAFGRISCSSGMSAQTGSDANDELPDFSVFVSAESKAAEGASISQHRESMREKVDNTSQYVTENKALIQPCLNVQEPHMDGSDQQVIHTNGYTHLNVVGAENFGRRSIQLRILTPRQSVSTVCRSNLLSNAAIKGTQKLVARSAKSRTLKDRGKSPKRKPVQSHCRLPVVRKFHRSRVPDLKHKTPVPILVHAMTEALTRKQTSSEGKVEPSDPTVQGAIEFIIKKQPILARILREQAVTTWENCTTRQYLKSMDGIRGYRGSHDGKLSRFLLPTVLPTLTTGHHLDTNTAVTEPIRTSEVIRTPELRLLENHKNSVSPSTKVTETIVGFDNSVSTSSTDGVNVANILEFQGLNTNVKGPEENFALSSMIHPRSAHVHTMNMEENLVNEKVHSLLVPRMAPKPPTLLHAVSQELKNMAPFTLEFFTQTLRQVIPEERWMCERNSFNLLAALERLGGDLLAYRFSSGHVVRFKLMSILAASASNSVLRKQLRHTAPMQGNWLDQLLRTLGSDRPTCRLEAALALAKLATETKLMKQLTMDTKQCVVPEIFGSLLRSVDCHPQSWPDCYMTLAFFVHYNQCQSIYDSLIDRGVYHGLEQIGGLWLRLVAHLYNYWSPTTLEALTVNEKRMSHILDAALRNPLTKNAAREAVAAISEYHTISCNLFSLWHPGSHVRSRERCVTANTQVCGDRLL